jgi:hypothetical protein
MFSAIAVRIGQFADPLVLLSDGTRLYSLLRATGSGAVGVNR